MYKPNSKHSKMKTSKPTAKKQEHPSNVRNSSAMFLMSLIPSLAMLPSRQKLMAQIDMTKIMQKYLTMIGADSKHLNLKMLTDSQCQTNFAGRFPKELSMNNSEQGSCFVCGSVNNLIKMHSGDSYEYNENFSEMVLYCYNVKIVCDDCDVNDLDICLNCVDLIKRSNCFVRQLELKNNLAKSVIKIEDLTSEVDLDYDEELKHVDENIETLAEVDDHNDDNSSEEHEPVPENEAIDAPVVEIETVETDGLMLKYYDDMPKLKPTDTTCPLCSMEFPEHSDLTAHYSTHFKMYSCNLCNVKFLRKQSYLQHISRNHKQKKFSCKICKRQYANKWSIKQHIHTAHKYKILKYGCPECPMRFLEYYTRNTHLENVHNRPARVYNCNICEKLFKNSSQLSTHIKRSHLQLRDNKCTECDRGFFSSKDLERHMLTHTGVRDFKCEHCGKCYGRKKTLKEHLKIHANLREHVCEKCGKSFIQKCTLKGHMKTHLND